MIGSAHLRAWANARSTGRSDRFRSSVVVPGIVRTSRYRLHSHGLRETRHGRPPRIAAKVTFGRSPMYSWLALYCFAQSNSIDCSTCISLIALTTTGRFDHAEWLIVPATVMRNQVTPMLAVDTCSVVGSHSSP